jgi:hypothetical protein
MRSRRCYAVSATLCLALLWLAVGSGGDEPVPTRVPRRAASTPAPAAVEDTEPRHVGAPLCLMAVGDSLTHGVGRYGGYRSDLRRRIAAEWRGPAVVFTGTQRQPCTVKRPAVPFAPHPDASLHEGHCNWASWTLLDHLRARVYNASARPAAAAAAPLSRAERECVDRLTGRPLFRAALLLTGHNDVFHAARTCAVREGCSNTSALPASAAACADRRMRDFAATLSRIVDATVRRLEASPAVGRAAPVLLLGLNPPTGFPCFDVRLHAAIRRVADGARAAHAGLVVRTVAFDGFERGPAHHTFDTTHPNERGVRLMGAAWFRALSAAWVDAMAPE